MYNWNTDTTQLQRDTEQYTIWKLNQIINYGLGGSKLDLDLVRKYWDKLSLDPKRKRFIYLLLWGTIAS